MKTPTTFTSRRALLRGCEFPPLAANPFSAGPRPAFYADGGDPPPPADPPPLTLESEIPEALRPSFAGATTFGAAAKILADNQTAIRHPKERAEDYDLTGLSLPEGVTPDEVKPFMGPAKKIGMPQEWFGRYAAARVESEKAAREAWRVEAEKTAGGAEKLTELENRVRVFGGDNFRLDGLDGGSLEAFSKMTERLNSAGLLPTNPGDKPAPTPGEGQSLTAEGKTFSVDPTDQNSISAFYNAEVETTLPDGTKKTIPLAKHPKFRVEHARIYRKAVEDAARESGLN